ncbi:DUF29 domain-containing protein [Planktothrix sp. FACHB-1355]|uniref:DUF29 domain-containing protein n=1 Tax=Aerosakkonema funiforme FACHB-1375 TaxID=2949571 RepID=A0A926VCT6_9CYAN|nr:MULTISPECIES: DUF29 domain-containing protein [Oscillatoriales]MBD2181442.1 DUF29 domain-containing protein [Aerosakkonema funiforme FACHB-1375]MBD3558709.1 DUF29 domain-containing protein [Planktothrix sp. FACHB-1355]
MAVSYKNSNVSNLYDRDFYLWIEETARLLREGKFSELDTENLIDEIESLGRWKKRELDESLLAVMQHLLKYQYFPKQRLDEWRATITEHRIRLEQILASSPSLSSLLLEEFAQTYQDAKKIVEMEMELTSDTLPSESPFTPAQTLDENLFPD